MKRMILNTVLTLGVLAATPVFAKMAASADKAAAPFAVDKASFVKVVSSSNAFEIESSKMAEEKATATDVKDFAAQMIADHTKAGEGLKAAAKLGDAPAAPLAPKHAAMLKLLEGASGDEFQALYIDMQAAAHREAVSLFATYAKGGDDAAVKAFAAKTLPALEMHKKHVAALVKAH